MSNEQTAPSIRQTEIPNLHVRPLRAIAKGGTSDSHLLAARAADEIERLTLRVVALEVELARYAKPGLKIIKNG